MPAAPQPPSAFSCGSKTVTCCADGGLDAGGAGGCIVSLCISGAPKSSAPPSRSLSGPPCLHNPPSESCPSLVNLYGLWNRENTGRKLPKSGKHANLV
ncbi:hypothetical protein AALO_G00208530 [Alosa alosa]|uniref:Uncharacterized protein n=1 Tax=Alosa alosa TaxID=278164 RepID=A0AAV6G2I6_9TELE|nr:hypothetical protein AALO_G00208530 [Alosa alosa]